jgi:hypothetical protein
MPNRSKVTLTKPERGRLTERARRGKSTTAKFIYARALLLCDPGEFGDSWKEADVASAVGVTSRAIEQLKPRFVDEGLAAVLARKPSRNPRAATFDGAFDARLTTLACSQRPDGYQRWTARLSADKFVELKIADAVSTMNVQRSLKKRAVTSPVQILEDSARSRRGVDRRDGERAGGVVLAVRSSFPGRLQGRVERAAGGRSRRLRLIMHNFTTHGVASLYDTCRARRATPLGRATRNPLYAQPRQLA